MIAVVTGASGFIGAHLVRALQRANAEVRVLRRPASGVRVSTGQARPPALAAGGAHTEGSTSPNAWTVDVLDREAVIRSDIWAGASHVFHLAGATRAVRTSDFTNANVLPTAHIAEALARCAVPPRLIVLSSLAAAGETPLGFGARTETMTDSPIEPYGRSKLGGERAAWRWQGEVPTTVLRPCAVYGPGDRDFLAAFAQVQRRVAWLAAAPEQAISMVYVADLIRCLQVVAGHPRSIGATWFVAHETPVTWRGLYQAMAGVVRCAPRLATIPSFAMRTGAWFGDLIAHVTGRPPLLTSNKLALALARGWVCSSEAITEATGWHAETALATGLTATLDAYVAEGWLAMASSGTSTPPQSDSSVRYP